MFSSLLDKTYLPEGRYYEPQELLLEVGTRAVAKLDPRWLAKTYLDNLLGDLDDERRLTLTRSGNSARPQICGIA
ncbi:hypothetical protein Baya_2853 [Bagarius yarrelli]|uniref:Uncharacterized protein n=1 Tax=Bagarius yarrelli TaxID=175774 RepID=A0A556TQT6_BAGYA|nr:hypothetical protein Baya_2853 [Bagarius yarrelli]